MLTEKFIENTYYSQEQELKDIDKEIQDKHSKMIKCKDEFIKESLCHEINRMYNYSMQLEAFTKENKDKYLYFTRDKRWFLIDYVNTEVHGEDWIDKYYKKHYSDLL
jgi:uncharacterized protein YcaQ